MGRRLELSEIDLARPRSGEVLVRVLAAGVCHSDLSAIEGHSSVRLPIVLGHEAAGVVEAVGDGVGLHPGTPVALSWMPSCGRCAECIRGFAHLCETVWRAMAAGTLLDGTARLSRNGREIFHYSLLSTFADRAVVAEASCVPIPPDVPFDVAAIVGCGVTTGIGAVWNTAGVRAGDRVAVVGCGGVGLSAVLGAVAVGAHPIVVVDVVAEKMDVARRVGATDAVAWQGTPKDTAAALREATGGGVDYAFEAAGRPETMLAAFLATRPRGATVIVGVAPEGAELRLEARQIPLLERRVIGSIYGSAEPRTAFGRILGLYRSGRLPLQALISHRLPFSQINEAIDLLQAGEPTRIVLTMD